MITRLRDAFDKAVRSAEDRQVHAGILGRIAEDGTYQIFVSERKEFVYVRTGSRGDRGVITARNRGVSAAFGLPVLYREDLDGHWALIGVDGMRLRGFTGGDAISTYNTPYHTHRTGSGLEYVQESRWFGLGRVALSSGLTVSIGSFRYPTSHDSWDTYGGGTLDLTASLPSAGKWVWVMVAIDPATNTETAISDTTEYDTQAELTVARIDDVDVEDYIPLAAVQLTSTDTTIPYSRFYEARFFLTNMPTLDQVGNPHADKTFTMATRTVTWRFTNPAGGMKWEWTGAASGHLWELNQNTGNPGAGTHLAHIEAEDADVLELHLDHVGDNAQHEFMRLQLDRATPTDNDEIRQAWYFDHDGAVTVQGEAEFARLGVIAEDVSEDSEDGAFAFSVMIAGALTEKARINATGLGIGTETPAVSLDLVSGPTTDSQAHIGEALDEGGWLLSTIDSQLMFTGGAQYVSASWTARSTTASGINLSQGQIAFYTDDSLVDGNTFTPTQRVIIDPDGQVGIGIDPPDGTLHVHTATAGAVSPNAGGDDLVVENNDSGGISILTPDNRDTNLYFGTPSNNLGAYLRWEHHDLEMTVGTNTASAYLSLVTGASAEAVRILSTGLVGIGETNPTTGLVVNDGLQIQGAAAPDYPSAGAGLEAVYDSDATWGLTTGAVNLQSYDRDAAAWKTFRISAYDFVFAIAGTTEFQIGNNGRVGINTAPHTDARVKIDAESDAGLQIVRHAGQPSMEADSSDGYLILDSNGQQVRLNNYVADDVILAAGGGKVGINATSPQGLLHSYRNGGGMIHWTATGIAGTSQTILPNGTGDVTGVMQLNYAVKTSTGGVNSGIRQLTPGSTYNVYSSGADILTLTCAADGSVSIARSGGSLTYTASLHFVWV